VVALKNPEAPASKKQLHKLGELLGVDTSNFNLTMQQSWDLIESLDSVLGDTTESIENLESLDNDNAFSEAHVQIVEGDQRGGKSVYAVKTIKEDWLKDAVRIFCEKELGMKCDVIRYFRKTRSAKIKILSFVETNIEQSDSEYIGKTIYIKIPEDYKLYSPKRIFSNIYILGVPFYYISSFREALRLLKKGFIRNGWLLLDEAHRGMSARNGMSKMGKEFVGEIYQFGKSLLDVIIITHHAIMIESLARLIPTKRVYCSYNKRTKKVSCQIREKGIEGTLVKEFYAPDWWDSYYTNQKVRA
jgi:hypothetical protein